MSLPAPDDAAAWTTALGGLLAGAAALAALSLQGLHTPCEGGVLCLRTVEVDPLARLALGVFAGGSLALAAVAAPRRRARRPVPAALALLWAAGGTTLAVGWGLATAAVAGAAPVVLAPALLAGLAAVCLLAAAVASRGDDRGAPPLAPRATLLGTGRPPAVAGALGASLGLGTWLAYPAPPALDPLFLAAAVAVAAAVAARGEGLAAAWAAGGPGWLALYYRAAAPPVPVAGGTVLAAAVQALAWGSLGYALGTAARRRFGGRTAPATP